MTPAAPARVPSSAVRPNGAVSPGPTRYGHGASWRAGGNGGAYDIAVTNRNGGPEAASDVVAGLVLPPDAEFTPDAGTACQHVGDTEDGRQVIACPYGPVPTSGGPFDAISGTLVPNAGGPGAEFEIGYLVTTSSHDFEPSNNSRFETYLQA